MRVFRRVSRPLRRNGRHDQVTMNHRLALLRAGRCYLCGGLVEDGLARVGSTLCHDCRGGCVHEPVRSRA